MAFQVFLYGLVAGTQVLLIALALYLIYAVSRVQNLALGAIAASVAYALYGVLQGTTVPFFAVLLVPLVLAVVLGIVNFFLNESFTRKQEYLLALLVSFSFGVILESLIAIVFGTDGKNVVQGILPVVAIGSAQIPLPGLGIIIFGFLVTGIFFFVTRCTPWGRWLKAISENQFFAMGLGMNQARIRFVTYIIASIIAGVVGVLSGMNTALVPTMGFNLVIVAFIAFLVGGLSDIRGMVVASYLVTLVPEFIIAFSGGVSASWKMPLVFVIAFLLLAVRPRGLFAGYYRTS